MNRSDKEQLRALLREERSSLCTGRAGEASKRLVEEITRLLSIPGWILSFATFGSEIDMSACNELLATRGRLVLPRVEGYELSLYVVRNLDCELSPNRWGILEPDPELCPLVSPDEIAIALVPGLGFDQSGGRIGYGMGFYDRLLPRLVRARCYGVGYREQLALDPIPLEPHDVSLGELILC